MGEPEGEGGGSVEWVGGEWGSLERFVEREEVGGIRFGPQKCLEQRGGTPFLCTVTSPPPSVCRSSRPLCCFLPRLSPLSFRSSLSAPPRTHNFLRSIIELSQNTFQTLGAKQRRHLLDSWIDQSLSLLPSFASSVTFSSSYKSLADFSTFLLLHTSPSLSVKVAALRYGTPPPSSFLSRFRPLLFLSTLQP